MVIDMKCKNCGANLPDTDLFCDQCGWKVVKERRCPECNAPLREGTKFCPKCGMLIDSAGKAGEERVFMRDAETTDIPIADIEQNILFETEREIHKSEEGTRTDKPRRAPGTERVAKAERTPRIEREAKADKSFRREREFEERAAAKIEREVYKKKAQPAPEPRRKERPVPVKKRIYDEWDDEEDDDDDDEDEGFSFITIVSVFTAFLILAVAVFLIFSMRKNSPVKNYGETQQEDTGGEQEEGQEGEDGGSGDGGAGNEAGKETEDESYQDAEIMETDEIQTSGTLAVTTDVNVRDNPSTEGTNVIKVAKTGEAYEYIGMTQDGSWYHIILEDGSTGYVSAKFVSLQ